MSSTSFSLRSINSDRELVFSECGPDYFTIELRGFHVRSVKRVYIYPGARDFAGYFSSLAAHRYPWKGVEAWESPEGDFKLGATCSTVGHVSFLIEIREKFGGPEEWELSAVLATELGQLPAIAKEADALFNVLHSA